MSFKIRNPELVEEELKNIESLCVDDLIRVIMLCSIRQFWRWVKLESNAKLSEVLKMSMSTEELIKKGYPESDVMEFMEQKVLELDKKKEGAEVELK